MNLFNANIDFIPEIKQSRNSNSNLESIFFNTIQFLKASLIKPKHAFKQIFGIWSHV